MMMLVTAAASAVATAVTMAETMMVVAVVAEAASVAAPMVSAPQPHPNPQQYFRFILFRNSPPIRHIYISGLFHLGIVCPYQIICLILHT